jgi:hypothetical protein
LLLDAATRLTNSCPGIDVYQYRAGETFLPLAPEVFGGSSDLISKKQ